MSKKVQVLLLETIPGIGTAGSITSVAEGYARNFLFPQGKAALAIEKIVQHSKQQESKNRAAAEQRLRVLQDEAEALQGSELTIKARIREGDELYGGITAARIAQELSVQAKRAFKAKDIAVPRSIKHLGSYDVTVHVSKEVDTNIKVTVVPKDALEADHEKPHSS